MLCVCNACLGRREDVTREWIAAASAGKRRMTHACSDDFAFVAVEAVTCPSTCPHCGNSKVVIPVDEHVAALVDRYRARSR